MMNSAAGSFIRELMTNLHYGHRSTTEANYFYFTSCHLTLIFIALYM